ncbi:MAG: symmetrical bis(5'-nucleosyl)-tetraphosphatase [Bermanella sp.]
MTRTFAVGDIQGCLEPLLRLLDKVNFDESRDQLWCVGDLVNRGPDSLGTLEFLHSIRKSTKVVLGNHDLHLLAIAYGVKKVKKDNELALIAKSKNADTLMEWLRKQPLLHWDKDKKLAMCHAGIPPMWDLKTAKALSNEVQTVLKSSSHKTIYKTMYGDTPDVWSDDLQGNERLRVIINYFTRMRFLGPNGQLNLENKERADTTIDEYQPWFSYPHKLKKTRLLFGHWAALEGMFDHSQITGLDTGCVWGGPLTLLHVETGKRYQQTL